jgi:signal transduction histidine kinase
MNGYSRRSIWAAAGFVAAALLVLSGLGWVTHAALTLEQTQADAAADAAFHQQIDLAMWRLENYVAPVRAAESARPIEHYRAIYSPRVCLSANGETIDPRNILEPSPLVSAALPDWEILHFHVSRTAGWSSPQVVTPETSPWADRLGMRPQPDSRQSRALSQLRQDITPRDMLARLGDGKRVPEDLRCFLCPVDAAALDTETQREQTVRQNQQLTVQNWVQVEQPRELEQRIDAAFCSENHHHGLLKCDACNSAPPGLPPLLPLWLTNERDDTWLAWVRPVPTHDGIEAQGVLLDWPGLKTLLAREVSDLLPNAAIEPDPDPTQRTRTSMCNLPVRLNAGTRPASTVSGWTSLRVGLATAWCAAAVALVVLGWGGWAVLELSERRQQFVSAVTHELRSPLTTLRLYLDLLNGGMVSDDARRTQYLQTLSAESDRLASLVVNVLDFARLENGRSRIARQAVPVQPMLEEIRQSFEARSALAGKSITVEDSTVHESSVLADAGLLKQILTNLLDNALKHTSRAADSRIWLRAVARGNGHTEFQVEDLGPGIPASDQKRIFRSFWRGTSPDGCSASGVGLGLTLARRWARQLGGELRVESPVHGGCGARFVVVLPSSCPPIPCARRLEERAELPMSRQRLQAAPRELE